MLRACFAAINLKKYISIVKYTTIPFINTYGPAKVSEYCWGPRELYCRQILYCSDPQVLTAGTAGNRSLK